ncbi:MAG: hypothetical protein ABI315_02685 [Bacteroidia bacterium]
MYQHSIKTNYTFDANNNETSEIVHSWQDNIWNNDEKYTYIIDNNNDTIKATLQSWNGIEWDNAEQTLNVFNANQLQISKQRQSWDTEAFYNLDSTHYYYGTITGIQNTEDINSSSNVYPNPFTSSVTIEVNVELINAKLQVYV